MKLTKTQLKQIIKEEIKEAIGRKSAMPVDGAILDPDGPIAVQGVSGIFNMDVMANGQSYAITGQLDPDVVEELIDDGVLKGRYREEISNITEDRQAHIEGIIKKIARLKKAVLNAEKGMENMTGGYDDHYDLLDVMSDPAYWAKQQEVMNLNDKIDVLKKQLDQLQQDSPGQLERG